MNVALKQAFKILGLFVGAYIVFFSLWMVVKNPYNYFITRSTFYISSWKYDLNIKEHTMKGRDITFILGSAIPLLATEPFEIELTFDVESVTFNVPMSLALIVAIILLYAGTMKTKLKLTAMAMATLFALHILTLLIIETSLIAGTTQSSDTTRLYFSRFTLPIELLENLGMILNSYAARFEPFLISILVWWKVQDYK